MSELGARKFTYDTIPAKRVKSNDDSDASSADTPNEGQEEKERMQRMTQAIRTIIDVSEEYSPLITTLKQFLQHRFYL